MPKRLKKAIHRLTKKTRHPPTEASPSSGQDNKDRTSKLSLLSLPAEIRNQIYLHLATTTTLTLPPTKPRKPLPLPALLLASHQTRAEYTTLLLAHAQLQINISPGYHFCNLIRVMETLAPGELEALRLNAAIWVCVWISSMPSRDDRRNVKGWVDYRGMRHTTPYFGPNAALAQNLVFEYDFRFTNALRPPRPVAQYANGYQMKLDLLRAHWRLYQRLEGEVYVPEGRPCGELTKLKGDVEDCVRLFEELQAEGGEAPMRSGSFAMIAERAALAA